MELETVTDILLGAKCGGGSLGTFASHSQELLPLFTQLPYSDKIPDKTAISG